MKKDVMRQAAQKGLLLLMAAVMLLSASVVGVSAATPAGTYKTFTQKEYVDAELVKVDSNGALSYYAEPLSGSYLGDFSGVGYHNGEKEIPDVKVVKTIEADGLGDHTKLIQGRSTRSRLCPRRNATRSCSRQVCT